MSQPLAWSSKMRGLVLEHVNKVVWEHPGSDRKKNIQMGFSVDQIRISILAKGLANFTVGYSDQSGKTLTPDELVSLYCYSNMKGHFFTCSATFREHRAAVENLFKPRGRVLMIDVGCGPATACLALADLLPRPVIEYVGIDSAAAMRSRAQRLFDAAKDGAGLLHSASSATFKPCWTDVPAKKIPPECCVMLVFSYFFASKSLTTQEVNVLAAWVAEVANGRTTKPLSLFYMTSPDGRANERYRQFKECLGLPNTQQSLPTKEIEFQTLKGGAHTSKRQHVCELLTLPVRMTAGTVSEEDLIPF
jgi:hypothetical protein